MKLTAVTAAPRALRVASQAAVRAQPSHSRFASTGPGAKDLEDKGTAKVYNKDGTNPNKNYVYLGLGLLGLGGVYAMFASRRETVPGNKKD